MIEKIYKNKYMAICDNCGTGQEFDTWTDTLEYMFEEGWKKKLIDGEWEHYCPECQESEGETGCLKRYWSWRCQVIVKTVH